LSQVFNESMMMIGVHYLRTVTKPDFLVHWY